MYSELCQLSKRSGWQKELTALSRSGCNKLFTQQKTCCVCQDSKAI